MGCYGNIQNACEVCFACTSVFVYMCRCGSLCVCVDILVCAGVLCVRVYRVWYVCVCVCACVRVYGVLWNCMGFYGIYGTYGKICMCEFARLAFHIRAYLCACVYVYACMCVLCV